MALLLLGVIGVFALALLFKLLWGNSNTKLNSKVVITATAVLVGVLGILAASGRMHWLMAAGTAVLPFLRRGFMLLRITSLLRQFAGLGSAGFSGLNLGGSAANDSSSETGTSELRMTLDHRSGEIDGQVLTGTFEGQAISNLSDSQIVEFYQSLKEEESKRLLESYIERHRSHLVTEESSEQEPHTSDGTMTAARAADVLGISEDATEEEIIEAHRRLVQHLHPDRGGSSYLTAELNEAKRVLLDSV